MSESKKLKGYFTVEASFIMPIVLFLYLAVLTAALLLYNRCVVSQDCYLVGLRGARFTWAEENYGEVIYGEARLSGWQREDYMTDRWQRKSAYYLEENPPELLFIVENNRVLVRACGENVSQTIEKQVDILNPVEWIRERRKQEDA
ncbi:MAG: pilus assembly protein [Lachnospiraceae bacterium]|nr:pilus assembly protein [Lachnospiraceae bacterium]